MEMYENSKANSAHKTKKNASSLGVKIEKSFGWGGGGYSNTEPTQILFW